MNRLNFGSAATRSQTAKLGTFLGVYTPTILTILGVIMYLRFGWVLGQVGLGATLLIVVMASLIAFITALSLSAVATNTRVGVGGAYYIISRSLGLEIGGAIGIPLFFSQALLVTLHSYGLAESLRFVWPEVPVPAAAFLIILAVGALAFRGADVALKAQVPVMVLIAMSILALAAGAFFFSPEMGGPAPAAPEAASAGFWAVFAVFFPAVTGIMAGLGLSGDLAEPKKAIPLGTLLALLTVFVLYMLIPLLLSMGAGKEQLLEDPLVWTKIAVLGPWLILPGLWGAVFSSAVGAILVAPRTLQAMAMDRLAPRFLGRLSPKRQEPFLGMGGSLIIALGAVFLGDLNTVALVVSMFFLSVYGTVNLVAALEELTKPPSWRPKLRVPWFLSLAGACGCFAVMLLINPAACAAAVFIELLLWAVLRRKERKADWGDVRRDVYEALIRWALIRLSYRPMSSKNWRPHILVFAGSIEKRLDLVRFGIWLSGNRGVVTVSELVVGDPLELDFDRQGRQHHIDLVLRREGLVAFGEANVVPSVERGIIDVAQANGIAGIESNTVLLGWPDELERLTAFLRVIRPLKQLGQSLIIGRVEVPAMAREGRRRTLHVWWGGLQRNGDLMLLLAYLMTRNPEWRQADIRILSIASNEMAKQHVEGVLERLIPEIRIDAEIEVMIKPEGVSVRETILRESAEADLVLLGLATPAAGEEEAYARRLEELVGGLPSFLLVNNGSLFIGELV